LECAGSSSEVLPKGKTRPRRPSTCTEEFFIGEREGTNRAEHFDMTSDDEAIEFASCGGARHTLDELSQWYQVC